MGKYNKAVITAAGENLLTRSVIEKKAVCFYNAKISDYSYPEETELASLTALEGVKQTAALSEARRINDNVIRVRAVLENTEVTRSYLIESIGVFVRLEGEDTEVLFSVCTAKIPDEMSAYDGESPVSFIYDINHVFCGADGAEITVNPAGTITVQEIGELREELENRIDVTYQDGKQYTDTQIAGLVNGASGAAATLKGLSDAINENKAGITANTGEIGRKADKTELTSHTGNGTVHITAAERTKWNGKQDKLTVDTALSGTSTNPVQNKVVTEKINENKAGVAANAEAVSKKADKTELTSHTGNGTVHITAAERTKWNGKQDKLTIDAALSGTSTNPVQNKAVTEKINENKAGVAANATAVSKKADKTELTSHTGNGTVHITAAERTKWNGKQDKLTVDAALNGSSTNPLQNKVVTEKINEINSNLATAQSNFQAGCSTIANKITACGVATATNASPATMSNNIQAVYNNRYNSGYENGRNDGYKEGHDTGYANGYREGTNANKGPFRVHYSCGGGSSDKEHHGSMQINGVKKIAVVACGARNDMNRSVSFSTNFGFNWSSTSTNISWSGYNIYEFSGTASISIGGNRGNDSSMDLDVWY